MGSKNLIGRTVSSLRALTAARRPGWASTTSATGQQPLGRRHRRAAARVGHDPAVRGAAGSRSDLVLGRPVVHPRPGHVGRGRAAHRVAGPPRRDPHAGRHPLLEVNWWEQSGIFSGLNTDKSGVTLDLATDRGRELLRDLLATCDVVVENYTPRVLEQIGLDVHALRAERPDLIVVRMPGFGLDGPWRDNPAFAFVIEDAAGLDLDDRIPRRRTRLALLRRAIERRPPCVRAVCSSPWSTAGAPARVSWSRRPWWMRP